eukprot:SM000016S01967  [mRNA]  locus=s16:983758:984185:- [translate_table: standard]
MQHGAADGQLRSPAIHDTSASAHDEPVRLLAILGNRLQAGIGVTSSPRAGSARLSSAVKHVTSCKRTNDFSAQA